MLPIGTEQRNAIVNQQTFELADRQLSGKASDADARGIIIVSGKQADLVAQDGFLDKRGFNVDLVNQNSFVRVAELFPKVADTTLGNAQFDGMLNQIVSLNGDIDSLLADYQKAVNGELLDASGKKVDPFVIQMKLQQAMQQRLEISNLLSTLMKMVHDGIEAITRNIA